MCVCLWMGGAKQETAELARCYLDSSSTGASRGSIITSVALKRQEHWILKSSRDPTWACGAWLSTHLTASLSLRSSHTRQTNVSRRTTGSSRASRSESTRLTLSHGNRHCLNFFALGLSFVKSSDWCTHTYQTTRATRGTAISSSTGKTNKSLKSKRTSGSRSTRRTLQTPVHMSVHICCLHMICLQVLEHPRGTNKD